MILYADRGDRGKSPGMPGAAMAIFADRRIKSYSPSVPVPAILSPHRCELPIKSTNQVGRFYHMAFHNGGHERGKWPGCILGM